MNQLLAGLALLVVTIYLARKKAPVVYTLFPMLFMLAMTGWAMVVNLNIFYQQENWMLLDIGILVLVLEIWMVVESVLILRKVHGPYDPVPGVDSAPP